MCKILETSNVEWWSSNGIVPVLPTLDGLQDLSVPLSSSISSAAIKDANEAVTSPTWSKPRGKYAKFTPDQQAAISEHASLDGNQAAICHFSKKFGVEMKVTSY